MTISRILDWFAGDGEYMRLAGCMHRDWLWIGITIALDLAVAIGYLVIARQWWQHQKHLGPQNPAVRPLGNLRNIFLFCGLCGYVFIPIKMFWPAWRLYDLFMVALVYFTWRYALEAGNIKVVYNELERTEKLSSELDRTREENKRRSLFLNAVSHDLRTPLNGLVLQAAVAEMSLDSDDPTMLRDSLSQMKITAKVAADLLNRLQELGRLDGAPTAAVARELDVSVLISDSIRRIKSDADMQNLAIRVDLPSGLIVKTDAVRLSRVVDNLLTNAVKFTESGSVSVLVEAVGRDLKLKVTDTGIGIAAEHVPHLFDEFYQVENVERNHSKGFGLGLSIVRRLCEQLDATVSVDSRPGFGSTFTIVARGCVLERKPVHATAALVAT